MPMYEYLCTKCGEEEDVIMSITDESDVVCSKCSSIMERQISASTFHLKGYFPGKALKSANNLAKHNEKHRKKKSKN